MKLTEEMIYRPVTSMKMISTGRVFFQPPEFAGITTMPLDKPLKVQRGEYIALYSGNSSRPLHLHSQAEQRSTVMQQLDRV